MRRLFAAAVLLLVCAYALHGRAQQSAMAIQATVPDAAKGASGAADLTIRLFSTAAVTSVHLQPHGATLKRCAGCAAKPVTAALDLNWSAAKPKALTLNGGTANSVELRGPADAAASNGQQASAAGVWKIAPGPDGLIVTITIPSERYVQAVLIAEASPGSRMEALKALAVTVRSFALATPRRHAEADLCDSTHCQAMRLAPVSSEVEQAVHATAGETLWFGGRRVPGYFSENSGGMTEDASTAWGGPREPWLITQPDPSSERTPSGWHSEVREADLRTSLAREGFLLHEPITGASANQRDPSGRVLKVELRAGAERLVLPAASLRFAVNRSMGWNQLRSDRYTVLFRRGSVIFDGRGFGHGVGLSQAGAGEMAKSGQDYRKILRFYFPGTAVRIGAVDAGWRETRIETVVLRSPSLNPSLQTDAAAAWGEARQRFPETTPPAPELIAYPTTDLFRGDTGEPGWALGVTRGDRIALQPQAVMAAQGSMRELMRHEFLHALVEHEAGAKTPLWLREGLVETLAGERCPGAVRHGTLNGTELDAALVHPDSLSASQKAHQRACAAVRQLVSSRGLNTVREWLRHGLPAGVDPAQ